MRRVLRFALLTSASATANLTCRCSVRRCSPSWIYVFHSGGYFLWKETKLFEILVEGPTSKTMTKWQFWKQLSPCLLAYVLLVWSRVLEVCESCVLLSSPGKFSVGAFRTRVRRRSGVVICGDNWTASREPGAYVTTPFVRDRRRAGHKENFGLYPYGCCNLLPSEGRR